MAHIINFGIQVMLGQVNSVTPKWPWALQGQRYTIYVLLILEPKFLSISLYDQPFSIKRLFSDKSTKWPQNDLEHYTVKRAKKFCENRKCTEWPHDDIKHFFNCQHSTVKSSLYIYTNYLALGPNKNAFRFTRHFRDTRLSTTSIFL